MASLFIFPECRQLFLTHQVCPVYHAVPSLNAQFLFVHRWNNYFTRELLYHLNF